VPSEYRKQELLVLLGNCVIVLALGEKDEEYFTFAREASEQHVAELDRDYPGWKEELE
jgi:hypothetical protein